MMNNNQRHVFWFSCGAASAVATKIGLAALPPDAMAVVARIVIDNEHSDNERFATDCASWFGAPIISLRSADFRDVDDVIVRTRYIAGPGGARCSMELKKLVRQDFQLWDDVQYFGYTADERARAERFKEHNLEVDCRFPLIDGNLTKDDCFAILHRVGIALPVMYELGYRNNNCIGCVKANSLRYWQRIRRDFPDVYARRSAQERVIGATVNRDRTTGERLYLDSLHERLDTLPDSEPDVHVSCGMLCEIAYQDIAE